MKTTFRKYFFEIINIANFVNEKASFRAETWVFSYDVLGREILSDRKKKKTKNKKTTARKNIYFEIIKIHIF